MRKMFACLCLAATVAIVATNSGSSLAGGKDEPKYTVSEVMKKGHVSGLLKKVQSGKATDEEAKSLLEMYQALAMQKPKKGDVEVWKAKTKELVDGAKLYVDGKKDEGAAALKKAVICKDCHVLFK